MLREYAVDPVMMASWERCKFLTSHFGIAEGRLFSRYPYHWQRLVVEAMTNAERDGSLRPVDRTRIVEKLRNIGSRMADRSGGWTEENSWIQNALNEHGFNPFWAIMSDNNPAQNERVIAYNETDDDEHPLWRMEHQQVTRKTAKEFAKAVAPLIRFSRRVVFVDPYFDPRNGRILNTVRIVLCTCLRSGKPSEVEFHTICREGKDNLKIVPDFQRKCEGILPSIIPKGIRLRVIRWQIRRGEDGFHNRYILTDRGGIQFPWGIEELDEDRTDDLTLMAEQTYHYRWNQFCGDTRSFDLVDEGTYIGTWARKPANAGGRAGR